MSRVLFLCPAPDEPTGGVRTIHRFARALSSRGIPAGVVHAEKAVNLSWLGADGDVPERIFQNVRLHAGDVFVVPEWWAWRLQPHLRDIRKVILNQGAYLSFLDAPYPPRWDVSPYEEDATLLTLAISADSERYLRHAFPRTTVRRVHLAIDPQLFHPADKDRAIAVMPRRRQSDQVQVLGILHNRGALDRWPLRPIDGVPIDRAAEILRQSAVYLSFTHESGEGFSLPIAEALSSGCVVVGYTGQGGAELLTETTGFPVPEGDVTGFAATVEDVLRRWEAEPEPLRERAAQGCRLVGELYTAEREQQDLVDALGPLAQDPAGPVVAELDLAFLVKPHRLARIRQGVRAVAGR